MPPDAFANLQALIQQVPGWAEKAMAYTCLWMEQYAKPNAPWNDQTGNARNSIQAGTTQVTGDVIEGALSMGYPGFGMSVEYTPYLELGTSRMAPRPIIWPTVQQAASQQIFERAFQSYLQQDLGG